MPDTSHTSDQGRGGRGNIQYFNTREYKKLSRRTERSTAGTVGRENGRTVVIILTCRSRSERRQCSRVVLLWCEVGREGVYNIILMTGPRIHPSISFKTREHTVVNVHMDGILQVGGQLRVRL